MEERGSAKNLADDGANRVSRSKKSFGDWPIVALGGRAPPTRAVPARRSRLPRSPGAVART